jgi:hypothetical protein
MPYSYKDALRAKGVKPIPKYSKLRSSKANAKQGDIELVPNGSQPIEPQSTPTAKKLRLVA